MNSLRKTERLDSVHPRALGGACWLKLATLVGAALLMGCGGDDVADAEDEGSTGQSDDTSSTGSTTSGTTTTTDASETTTADECATGEQQDCECPEGGIGTRACLDGAFGVCECEDVGSSSSSSTTGDSSSESGDPAFCGDGNVDDGEQCDDGDDDDSNACSNDCLARCGEIWSTTLPAQFLGGLFARSDGDFAVGHVADGVVSRTQLSPDGDTVQLDASAVEIAVGNPSTAANDDATYIFGPLAEPGEKVETPRLYGLDEDIALAWRIDLPSELLFDTGHSVDIDAEGNVILAATISVADGDTDIWVAKYAAEDGAELWTTTYSGPNVGGFSLDEGGRVAVTPSGEIRVLGRVRASFNQRHVLVVTFGPDGGPALRAENVLDDPGSSQEHNYSRLARAPSTDLVAASFEVFHSSAGLRTSSWGVGLMSADDSVIQIESDQEVLTEGSAYQPLVALDETDLWVASIWAPDNGELPHTIISRYDHQGVEQCSARYEEAPGVPFFSLALGDMLIVAGYTDEIWVSAFRK